MSVVAPATQVPTQAPSSTPKKAKALKSPKKTITKQKVVSSHPTYREMIRKAVNELKEKKGSSRAAILKYILHHYKLGSNFVQINAHLRQALKRGVASGALKQTKGVGAAGSFRIGAEKTAKKVATKAPKAVKKTSKPSKKIVKKSGASPKKPKAAKAKKPQIVSGATSALTSNAPQSAASAAPKSAKKVSAKKKSLPKKVKSTPKKTIVKKPKVAKSPKKKVSKKPSSPAKAK